MFSQQRHLALPRLAFTAIMACALAVGAFGAPVFAQGGTVVVSLRPAATNDVQVGQIFQLDLYISAGTQQVDSIDAVIHFPAQYFEVVDTNGNPAPIVIPDLAKFPSVLHNSVDNTTGTIQYSAGIQLGTPAVSGEFRVASIRFKVKTAVPCSGVPITLDGTDVFFQGNSVALQLQSATVKGLCTLTPNFTGTPTSGYGPLTVKFTDTSTAQGCTISSWAWDFGDKGTSTEQSPPHQYAAVAVSTQYTVKLTVTSNCGNSQTATKANYITVIPPEPGVNFSGTPTSGCVPLTVKFTDTSTPQGCTISAWAWDFGDGGTSAQQNPSHPYTVPGQCTVKLTATCGGTPVTATKANYITVNALSVVADFSGTPLSGKATLNVQFKDKSTAGCCTITSWLWDFGDGTTSTQQNPLHPYSAPGQYTVKLTVTCDGTSKTVTKTNYVTTNETGPSSIPEPTTLLLLGTGLAGLASYLQRRRRRSGSM